MSSSLILNNILSTMSIINQNLIDEKILIMRITTITTELFSILFLKKNIITIL